MECDWVAVQEECDICDGLGVLPWVGICATCAGTGWVEYEGPAE